MAFIVTILFSLGLFAWILIFLFMKAKKPKCTFDLLKMISTIAMIMALPSAWIFSITVGEKVNLGIIETKGIILQFYFFLSHMTNTVSLFNLYSFVFEHRNPKIDPNLPHWLTCILAFLIPICCTILTFFLDGLMEETSELDFLEYATNIKGEK